ncbi:MAG TPA: glycosyltransferase family 39 protein [Planctomycetota bacterium]|jgi:hypothetical protein
MGVPSGVGAGKTHFAGARLPMTTAAWVGGAGAWVWKYRVRLSLVTLFIIAAGFMCERLRVNSHGMLFTGDGFGYYSYLPSVVIDHDLDLSNQLTAKRIPTGERSQLFYFENSTVTGRRINLFPIGPAIVWSPWFVMAHGAALVAHNFDPGVRTDGYGWHYEIPVYLGSLLSVLLGVYWTYLLLKRRFETPWPEVAMAAAVLATPFVAFQFCFLHQAHGLGAASLAGYLVLCDRAADEPDRRRSWAWLGFAWGMLFLIRWQSMLYGAIGVALVVSQWRSTEFEIRNQKFEGNSRRQNSETETGASCFRKTVERLLIYGGVALATVTPQFISWKILFGKFILVPQNASVDHPHTAGDFFSLANLFSGRLAKIFFDPGHGLLTPTPLILLALAGLILARKKLPVMAWLAVGLILLETYVGAMAYDWWGGEGCFAHRRMADAMPLYALGFAGLLWWASAQPRKWRVSLNVVSVFAVSWGMISFVRFLLERVAAH